MAEEPTILQAPSEPTQGQSHDNTVVTICTERYLWGTFLLIASMRKCGMNEPVLVGIRHLSTAYQDVLRQFGNVRMFSLDNATNPVGCYKPLLMLQVNTPYVTWVNSDGFFTGNVSRRLPPLLPDQVHVRMRGPEENPQVFHGFTQKGEDGSTIPEAILNVWRDDIDGLRKPLITRACSCAVVSVHESSREFLRKWHYQVMSILPAGEVEADDRTQKFYRLLSESVLNSVLAFWPQAPRVASAYALDKDPEAQFVHFASRPKPWHGWTVETFAYFDRYLDILDWVKQQGYRLPGAIPFSMKRSNRALCAIGKSAVSVAGYFRRAFKG